MSALPPSPRHWAEATLVVAICFGLFIAQSVSAVAAGFPTAGQFNDASFASLIGTELVLGAMALGFLRYRGYPIERLRPQPSWAGLGLGVLVFAAAMLAWTVVWNALSLSAGYAAQPIAEMAAKARVSLPMALAVGTVNGLYEETFVCGYLQDTFRSAGASVAIGLSTLVRILYHLYQGPTGTLSVLVFGVVIGAFYWRTGRLWPVACAHAIADITAFA
jgi:membrane protease YdiL (CAAX protease family)